jgi:glucose-1-phosphate cytidylyltransferase
MTQTAVKQKSSAATQLLKDSPLIILCGGKGTRLREETEWRPKPMVNVGEWPILWHIMRYYSCFGVRKFMLCLGYKGQVIRDFFLSYHERWADLKIHLGKNDINYIGDGYDGDDWEITLVNTGLETKTGGRVSAMSRYLSSERFLLTYGDGLSNVDLNKLAQTHLDSGTIGTVTAVRPVSRFGELGINDKTSVVHNFSEKPQVSEGWVNGGFFVFNRSLFDYIPNPDVSLEMEPLHALAQDGQLSAYKHEGFWQCVDTYRELEYVEKLWAANSAPWRIW